MRRVAFVAVLATIVGVLAIPNAQAASPPLPSDGTLIVPGHGWGHGRGLGQWGANGMARSGKTYTQILSHYYSGVTFTARASENIRVLVAERSSEIVTSDAAFTASWNDGTRIATSSTSYPFFRVRWNGSAHVLEKSAAYTGPWSLVASSSRWVVFTKGSSLLQVVSPGGSVHYYRGSISARLHRSTGLVMAVNELMLDEYLFGVVPREMPASWPAEALKSQSVAARTYAVYKKDYARSQGYPFDICATTSCQSYLGYASKPSPTGTRTVLEHPNSNAAVTATTRKVLTYGGKPILAEYSSSTGGYTAPGNVPYQRAVPDSGDSVSPHHNWTARVRVADVEKKWPIGRLVDVVITKRNGYGEWGGRVLEMKLIGTSSTAILSGNAWRAAFAWPTRSDGVRSSWFTVRYWRGELAATPPAVTVTSGDTATLTVQIRNTGNTSWPVGGPVRLSTRAASRFATSSWISPTRPAGVSRNVTTNSTAAVGRDQVAEFRVPISSAGLTPGSYSETFTLVADGTSTMTPTFTVPIQILPGWRDDVFNVLENASFESGLRPWSTSGLTSGDGRTTVVHRVGTATLRLTGGGSKIVYETVRFAGGTARRFTLGAWSRSDGSRSSGGPIDVQATAVYGDGTSSTFTLAFPRGSHAWRYGETAFATNRSKSLSRIAVRARYVNQTGTGYFDALRLVETPIRNASFEQGLTGWTGRNLASGDGSTAGPARDGGRALVFQSGLKQLSQPIALSGLRSERFVLSGWNRSAGTASHAEISVALEFVAADGSKSATRLLFPTADHDWRRGEIVVTAPFDFTTAVVTLTLNSFSGSTSFDAIHVARNFTANPSFENGLGSWSSHGFASGDGVWSRAAGEGSLSMRLAGSGRQSVSQSVAKSGGAGGRLILSGWSRLSDTSTSRGTVGLLAGFRNTDGSTSWVTVPFAKAPHQWAYTEAVVVAPKRYSRVDVFVTFYDQSGWGAFDGVTLRLI